MELGATAELPSIDLLEKIIMDDIYFSEFSNNKNEEIYGFNQKELLTYLKDYIRNRLNNDNNLTEKFILRAKYYNDKFNLDIPKLRKVEDGLDHEFYEFITRGINEVNNPLVQARLIYLRLAKVLCYDEHVPAYNQNLNNPVVEDIYYRSTSSVNLNNPNVTCKLWAEVYAEFLKEIGISAKVNGQGKHKFVEFSIEGQTYTADATNSFLDQDNLYLNDLMRIKLNSPSVGFSGVDKIDDEQIGFNPKSLVEQYHEFSNSHAALSSMRLTSGDPEIDMISSKLDYLSTIAYHLPQIEAVAYLKQMVREPNSIVTKQEQEKIMPRQIRFVDENNLEYTSLVIAIKNGDEYIYKLLHVPEGLVNVSKGYFENLIADGKLINDGNIPGVGELNR